MLRSLSIRDFVIVDRLELEFSPGFTVLTGETGAGKSILIDALALVLGERADPVVVRAGADRALSKMLDIAIKRAGTETVDIAVEHFDAAEKASRLLRKLRRGVPNVRQFMLTQVSSAIGAHVGPGALGITVSPI